MNKDGVLLLGRILVALLFVPAGFGKLMGFEGTVGMLAGMGLPLPQLLAVGAVVVELGVGLAFLLGWKARWAALILAIFTVATALMAHHFWTMSGAAAGMNKIHFFKNMAISGGLLFACVFGPGRYSLDRA